MKLYLILAVLTFSLFACETERSTGPIFMDGRQMGGTFVVTYNEGTSQQYSETGTVTFLFRSGAYSYHGAFDDTTVGRGHFFKTGIGDQGAYSIMDNLLNLHDRALDIGTMNPIGVPSLYLGGQFQIREDRHRTIITQQETNRRSVLILSR